LFASGTKFQPGDGNTLIGVNNRKSRALFFLDENLVQVSMETDDHIQ
jgi:hypothetical protein